jgi:beta-lactam-binding protein with PASTA domain
MFAEKLKVLGQTLLTLFILVSAGFLSALTAMRFAVRGQVVTVPSVVGFGVIQGEKQLAASKLFLKVETRVYNDILPENAIVSQDPPAGAQVKARGRVSVILSLGKRKVPIPDLVKGTLRAAQINLVRRGLALGVVATINSSNVEKDRIVAQEPPADAKEVFSPKVDVVLSRGPAEEAFLVPDFISMDFRKAGEIVTSEGFAVGAIRRQVYPGVPGGVVIAQQPPAGGKIRAGGVMDFTVSK